MALTRGLLFAFSISSELLIPLNSEGQLQKVRKTIDPMQTIKSHIHIVSGKISS